MITVPFDPSAANAASKPRIRGAWKDDIFACCRYGICHPSFVNAVCCCKLMLLGQVMTRLKLDWLARPASDVDAKKTFKITVILTISYGLVMSILSPPPGTMEEDGEGDMVYVPAPASPLYSFIGFAASVFLWIIMTQVRKLVREKYDIPEQSCIGCEDLCCSFWCTCCTISQLARQTADYDTEEARFFTDDGLAHNTLSPVLTV